MRQITIALAILGSATGVAAREWVAITTVRDKSYEVDFDGLTVTPPTAQAWARVMNFNRQKNEPWLEQQWRVVVDCKGKTFAVLAAYRYSEDGQVIATTKKATDPDLPPPGSVGEAFVTEICRVITR